MAKVKANNMMSISIELTRSSSGLLTTQNHKNWLESTGFSSRIFTQRFLLCVPFSCATDQLDVWKNTVSGAWCARVLLNRGCWNMWNKHWPLSTWSACETSTCHCHWLNSRHLISLGHDCALKLQWTWGVLAEKTTSVNHGWAALGFSQPLAPGCAWWDHCKIRWDVQDILEALAHRREDVGGNIFLGPTLDLWHDILMISMSCRSWYKYNQC